MEMAYPPIINNIASTSKTKESILFFLHIKSNTGNY